MPSDDGDDFYQAAGNRLRNTGVAGIDCLIYTGSCTDKDAYRENYGAIFVFAAMQKNGVEDRQF